MRKNFVSVTATELLRKLKQLPLTLARDEFQQTIYIQSWPASISATLAKQHPSMDKQLMEANTKTLPTSALSLQTEIERKFSYSLSPALQFWASLCCATKRKQVSLFLSFFLSFLLSLANPTSGHPASCFFKLF